MKKHVFVATVLFAVTSLVGCAADNSDDAATPGDEQDISAASASARIETFEGLDGQHYFHLVAKNGEVVLQSEGYRSLDAAKNGVKSVLENGGRSSAFEMRDAKDGDSYFVLKAPNSEIIGVSETYASRSNADRGANTVKSLMRELADKQPSAAPPQAKFETFEGEDGLTYFNLRAKNGQTMLSSQGYQNLQNAKKGVASVKENGVDESRFEVLEARDGQFYVRLKAGNNEIIGRTEMYASESNATRARDTMVSLLRNREAR